MVIPAGYVPDRGDLVWLDFSPHRGHEQGGRRPALVISGARYNRPTSLVICCPLTRRAKGYGIEVPVHGTRQVSGVVLADALKNLDWSARRAEFIERAPTAVLDAVLGVVSNLLFQ